MKLQDLNALIINLKHRTDRYEHASKEIQKLPVKSYEFFEAINDGTGRATASHNECVRIAKERGWPQVLILEDDFYLIDGAVEILEKALDQLPEKWDMFYGGANLQEPAVLVSENVLRLFSAWCAHFVVINSSFYDKILSLPMDLERDISYNRLMKENNVFMVKPMISFQIPSPSDLINRFADYRAELDWNYQRFAV